jgi:hypothetical protein
MKLYDALNEFTYSSGIYLNVRTQHSFWWAGKAEPRELDKEKKDERYSWKAWKKWRKKLKKTRKKDEAR